MADGQHDKASGRRVDVAARGPNRPAQPPRSLGLFDATTMVVGIILGSGIFVAPAAIASLTSSPAFAVGLWALGAVVAGFGALCYAECGARLPQDGGFFIFFRHAFGWRWAFVAGWAALLLSYPMSLAGVAAMGAQYLAAALPAVSGLERSFAIGAITLAALLNGCGLSLGRWSQRVMASAKVLAIVGVLAAAFWQHFWHGAQLAGDALPLPLPPEAASASVAVGLVLQVLATIMWTYDGWTDVTMVAGEVRSPARNLPRAVLLSLGILFLLYAAVQLAVMQLLGPAAAGQPHVLALALGRAFGLEGERVLAWLVLLTTWGSIVGLVFATSRLTLAMAQRGAVSHRLAHLSGKDRLPRRAIFGVWLLASGYVLLGTFAELLEMFSLIIWLFYGATAVALLRLRARQIGGQVAGFGFNGGLAPFVLIAAAVAMTGLQVAEHPARALCVAALLGLARAGVDPLLRAAGGDVTLEEH